MVAVVMVLLAIGMLIMTSLNRQLSAQLRIDSEERYYLKSYNQAVSSLNWGLGQGWPRPAESWHCQRNQALKLDACIKILANSENVLLKGSGAIDNNKGRGSDINNGGNGNSDNKNSVTLYYLASLKPQNHDGDSPDVRFNLKKLASGWLDFCPAGEC